MKGLGGRSPLAKSSQEKLEPPFSPSIAEGEKASSSSAWSWSYSCGPLGFPKTQRLVEAEEKKRERQVVQRRYVESKTLELAAALLLSSY